MFRAIIQNLTYNLQFSLKIESKVCIYNVVVLVKKFSNNNNIWLMAESFYIKIILSETARLQTNISVTYN